MAESPLKRQREETQIEEVEVEETKRQKSSSSSSSSSYNHILSLLIDEAEEEEPAQDLSSLTTSLQHELYSESTNTFDPITSSSSCSKEGEVDDKERVMRHLLEASDDELGIPSMEVGADSVDYDEVTGTNSVDVLALCDGLWDLEDDAANFYTPDHVTVNFSCSH